MLNNNCNYTCICNNLLLKKVNAAQNEVVLSYHRLRVRGLCFCSENVRKMAKT